MAIAKKQITHTISSNDISSREGACSWLFMKQGCLRKWDLILQDRWRNAITLIAFFKDGGCCLLRMSSPDLELRHFSDSKKRSVMLK